jgi:TolB-like protein/Tfp pilus assembly protein PilF
MNFNEFFNELKRRNVFKGTISYLVFSWVLLQAVSILSPVLNAPAWFGKMILILLIVLLPVWVTVSWFFEVTSDGVKKTKNVPVEKSIAKKTGQKFNAFIIVFLTLAIILLFVDRFRIKANTDRADTISEVNQPNDKSIAVLPFRDISPNKNQEYFADGLAEELLNSLAKIPELQVTSRTSAFSFKNKSKEISQIGKELKVNYILEGSVRTSDSLIRIGVQLIETKNDKNIWSQTWDKEIKNIFQIQDEIAEAVVTNLQLRILDNVLPKAKEAKTESYALYLKSKFELSKINGFKGVQVAQNLLKQSLKIDSTYAPAWVLLSQTHHILNNFGVTNRAEGYPLAKNAALRAVQEDSTYALAYTMLSEIAIDYERDLTQAEKYTKKALELEPNNAEVIEDGAEVFIYTGRMEESIALRKKALALDPVNESNYYNLANAYYYDQQYEKAVELIKESLSLNPNQEYSYFLLATATQMLGQYDQALVYIEKEPIEAFKIHSKAMLYYLHGNKEESDRYLKEFIDTYEKDFSYQIAITYAVRNNADKVFYWLEKANDYHDFGLIESKIEPLLNPYRKDPRWGPFSEKLDFK